MAQTVLLVGKTVDFSHPPKPTAPFPKTRKRPSCAEGPEIPHGGEDVLIFMAYGNVGQTNQHHPPQECARANAFQEVLPCQRFCSWESRIRKKHLSMEMNDELRSKWMHKKKHVSRIFIGRYSW